MCPSKANHSSWELVSRCFLPRQLLLRPLLFMLMAPKKATIQENLDLEREVPMDPRDPRSKPSWPCMGNHVPSRLQGNKWAAWSNCQTCALRLRYVPKVGAPGNQAASPNPKTVQKVLNELREALEPGMMPNEELFKIYMEKSLAEDRIQVL